MSRPRKCKICNGDPAITSQIDALIASGVRLKVIAEQVSDFSIYQLSRHKNNCLAVNVAIELTPSAGSTEIQKWLQRAEATYLTAQVDGDTRSAVSAISTAVRSLSQLEKQFEREAKTEKDGVDRDSPEFTIAGIDAMLRQQAERGDIENGVTQRGMTLLSEEPAFGQIVQAIWKNRGILPALLACCDTDYLPQRQSTTEEHAND